MRDKRRETDGGALCLHSSVRLQRLQQAAVEGAGRTNRAGYASSSYLRVREAEPMQQRRGEESSGGALVTQYFFSAARTCCKPHLARKGSGGWMTRRRHAMREATIQYGTQIRL
jgi:hypothetical protein